MRRAAFAAQLLINGGNQTQAAIDVGCSPKSAHVTANKWLKTDTVQRILGTAQAKVVEKAVITVTRVVEELRDILTVDIGEAFDDTGKLKPLKDIPVAIRRGIAGLENEEITQWDADSRKHEVIGTLRKVKFWSKTDAGRELLKHLPGGYAAQKHEHEVTVTTLAEDVIAAQARLAAARKK